MTEKELRQKVLDAARDWLACSDRDGSYMKIIDVYNTINPLPRGYKMKPGDPWCAAYVSAVAKVADCLDIIFPECGCKPMMKKYQEAGCWVEDDNYLPTRGDLVFYDWQDSGVGDNTGDPDHVGIVWSVYGNNITVIEGNYSHMVCFHEIKRGERYIRGYAVPNYAGKADEEEPTEPEKPETCQVTLPVLMIGDDSEAVRAAQYLLEKRGFKCGWSGCDGEFGPKTESAAGKFQRANDLPLDGIIDADDWTVLIVGVKKSG